MVVTDDLDGSANAETVSFSVGGVTYEIDLGSTNRARLELALAPFMEASRRVPGSSRGGAGHAGGSWADRTAVRAWAKTAGLTVGAV
jgi:hypothetical protein